MASLDNFHTGNPVPPLSTAAWFPSLHHRHHQIRRGLFDSNITGDWANRVPVGPSVPAHQTAETAYHLSRRPDPTLTERIDGQSAPYYVRTRPYTRRLVGGDTAESHLVFAERGACCPLRGWWDRLRVPLVRTGDKARYHPY